MIILGKERFHWHRFSVSYSFKLMRVDSESDQDDLTSSGYAERHSEDGPADGGLNMIWPSTDSEQ